MRTPNCVRDNAERSAKGLTLRLNIDTLAVLDKMKEDSGIPKGVIVDKAVMYWYKHIYSKMINDMKTYTDKSSGQLKIVGRSSG